LFSISLNIESLRQNGHEWRNRPIERPYVYLDRVWLNREFAGEVRPVAGLVAIGVNADAHRVIRA
jgi:putative transposase